jgi:hypothetical protein
MSTNLKQRKIGQCSKMLAYNFKILPANEKQEPAALTNEKKFTK